MTHSRSFYRFSEGTGLFSRFHRKDTQEKNVKEQARSNQDTLESRERERDNKLFILQVDH